MPITLRARTGPNREQTCTCLQHLPSSPSSGLQSHTQKGVSIHTTASKASRVTLNPLDHLFPNFFSSSIEDTVWDTALFSLPLLDN